MPAKPTFLLVVVALVFIAWMLVPLGHDARAAEGPIGSVDPLGEPLPEGQPTVIQPPVDMQPPPEMQPQPGTQPQAEMQPQPEENLGLLESNEQMGGEYGDYAEYSDGGEYVSYGPVSDGVGRRLWFRSDYLLWWTRRNRLPPLVTTSPVGAPPGVLGYDTTEVLFGDSRLHSGSRSGFRLTMGYWLDCCQALGIEADYWDLEGRSTDYSSGFSAGNPVLARPFYDVVNQIQSSQTIAYPGYAVGDIRVGVSDYFQSTGAWLRLNLCCLQECHDCTCYSDPCSCETGCSGETTCYEACDTRVLRLDLIGGYRYYRLIDHLGISEHVVSTFAGGQVIPGTTYDIQERFRADNDFNGGELGLTAQLTRGRWTVELLAKMALGNHHQAVTIDGSTTTTVPGFDPVVHQGGLLALHNPHNGNGNIGVYTRDRFVVVPQFGVELGYQMTDRMRLTFGYNILYWAQVARAGDEISLVIDPRNIPPADPAGGPDPQFQFRNADFWAQGMNFGLEFYF